jgi:hypothetical protein
LNQLISLTVSLWCDKHLTNAIGEKRLRLIDMFDEDKVINFGIDLRE